MCNAAMFLPGPNHSQIDYFWPRPQPMKKNQLFVTGRISEREVTVFARELANEDFSISKYASAAAISGIQDIVNLIFRDFSAVGFLRDFAMGKILEFWLSKLSGLIGRLREKAKVVHGLPALMEYHKQDGSIIFLELSCRGRQVS